MSEKIKTICLIIITISVVIGVGFYCYNKYMRLKMDGAYGIINKIEMKYGK